MTGQTNDHHKSNIIGTTFNLINAIVGAGIVGIPYAMRESGFVAGLVMVIFCAVITEKSLRMLVSMAQLINVSSYEELSEACFGRAGFVFISFGMFIMAYGAMVSYLMIVRDMLPEVFGIEDDIKRSRALFVISSLCIIFPLSAQRDMADLAKTSTINVCLDCILVLIVAYTAHSILTSPQDENIPPGAEPEPVLSLLHHSIIHPQTFFTGLGVLSFAFVCQHSAFIIANSLRNPTPSRWGRVTRLTLTTCACLALTMGFSGYSAFRDETKGNVLLNLSIPGLTHPALAEIARGALCTTMCFVYPLESFVARYVISTFFFGGEEDMGTFTRVALTFSLYILALIPALAVEELGNVLAITGAIGGSCLSYIAPGVIYLGVHGEEFLQLVHKKSRGYGHTLSNALGCLFLMPIWCAIADLGRTKKNERKSSIELRTFSDAEHRNGDLNPFLSHKEKLLSEVLHDSMLGEVELEEIALDINHSSRSVNPFDILERKNPNNFLDEEDAMAMEADEEEQTYPNALDFSIAIGFILFGVLAATAGFISILTG